MLGANCHREVHVSNTQLPQVIVERKRGELSGSLKSKDYGNQQPSPNSLGKVQRLSRKGVGPFLGRPEVPRIHYLDDDIVHTIKKLVGKCNQLVVGSNPTPGASVHEQRQEPLFLLYLWAFWLVLTLSILLLMQDSHFL